MPGAFPYVQISRSRFSRYIAREKTCLRLAIWPRQLSVFGRLRRRAQEVDPVWLGPWLLSHAGKILLGARQWELSDAVYQEAIAQAANAGPVVRAELFRQRAAGFARHQDLARCHEVLSRCLA